MANRQELFTVAAEELIEAGIIDADNFTSYNDAKEAAVDILTHSLTDYALVPKTMIIE